MFKLVSKFSIIAIFLITLSSASTLSQDQCDSIVENAISTAIEHCAEMSEYEVCYGNPTIDVIFADGAPAVEFDQPGDKLIVTDIDALRLGNQQSGQESANWGITTMRLKTDEIDEPSEFNLIAMGGICMEDRSGGVSVPDVEIVANVVSASGSVNVYDLPLEQANIVDTLSNESRIKAIARDESSGWVGYETNNTLAWIEADHLVLKGDINTLPVATILADVPVSVFSPMQAFYFESNNGNVTCNGSPQNGIFIETREDEKVEFWVDEWIIEIGSLVFLRTDNQSAYLTILEGNASIDFESSPVTLPAGVTVRLPFSPISAPEVIPYEGQSLIIPRRLLNPSVQIAQEYTTPIILNIPFVVLNSGAPPRAVRLDYYNAGDDDIQKELLQPVDVTPSNGPIDETIIIENEVNGMPGNSPNVGSISFERACNIDLVTTSVISTFSVRIEDTDGNVSEPYQWSFLCTS
jgi:hypothetical protein